MYIAWPIVCLPTKFGEQDPTNLHVLRLCFARETALAEPFFGV
jgi:hypothetical protein